MNFHEAKGNFTPPPMAEVEDFYTVSNLLMFVKGDQFESLEEEEDEKFWWAVRALKGDEIGYVPSKYLKKIKNIPETTISTSGSNRELHMQMLAALQRRTDFRHPANHYHPEMIPDPDYSDSDDDQDGPANKTVKPTVNGLVTEDGTVVPRKLSNPCVESKDRQNLHRELMFNQKIGKNVLNQKSELRKAMDKFQEDQKKKELEQEQFNKRTSLEKKLEEQASKLQKEDETDKPKEDSAQQSEFLRIHAKLRARMEPQ